jgi:hypothetical protein
MKTLIQKLVNFKKAQVFLETQDCSYYENNKMKLYTDSFTFYSKQPYSKSFQYTASISLDATYSILKLIQTGIKKNQTVQIIVRAGMGTERINIHKSVLKDAEKEMLGMITKIQEENKE